MREKKCGTYDARRIVGRNDDILQSELVQIKCVPSQLGICAIKTLAAPHELNKQRDRTLDDSLRLREQRLVLGSRGGTLREQCARRGALALCTSEEVCARCGEWAAVDGERGAAFDVEARMGEWAEGRKSRGRRVAWLRRESDRTDGREGEMRQLDHELRELRDQRVLRLRRKVLEDRIQTDTRDLHMDQRRHGQSDEKSRIGIGACLLEEHMRSQRMGLIELIGQDFGYRDRRPFSDPLHRRNLFPRKIVSRVSYKTLKVAREKEKATDL